MVKLGQKVKDKITKFEGTVTGRAEYLTGCAQVLVVPGIGADGAMRAAEWFDEQRLDVDTDTDPVTLDNRRTPGPDKAAPKQQ